MAKQEKVCENFDLGGYEVRLECIADVSGPRALLTVPAIMPVELRNALCKEVVADSRRNAKNLDWAVLEQTDTQVVRVSFFSTDTISYNLLAPPADIAPDTGVLGPMRELSDMQHTQVAGSLPSTTTELVEMLRASRASLEKGARNQI